MQSLPSHLPGPAPDGRRTEPTEEEIQHAAYFLWLERGRPVGTELETWMEARERLRHRHLGPDGAGLDVPPLHFPAARPKSASPFVPAGYPAASP